MMEEYVPGLFVFILDEIRVVTKYCAQKTFQNYISADVQNN